MMLLLFGLFLVVFYAGVATGGWSERRRGWWKRI